MAVAPDSTRPLLRWAGSKRKLLPQLLANLPENFDRYVEPFAGSACLFFSLRPKRALLADINEDLIGTYRAIKKSPESVAQALKRLKRDESTYYRIREAQNSALTPENRAARFIYLNRLCFNGLYRTNKDGKFNVPYGGEKSGKLPDLQQLKNYSSLLKRARLLPATFEETLEEVKSGDFVYIDPPYCIKSRRVFNEYSNAAFGPDQLKRLRQQMIRLDKAGIQFLVSYGYSAEALALSTGFERVELMVQRQIAGFSCDRRKSREIMIKNF